MKPADLARSLRQNPTDAEARLWYLLRDRRLLGHKFRRQHPLPPYVVDFVCLKARLIIELDGGQHLERKAYDDQRTAYLERKGFRVLRFWNDEVLIQSDVVLEVIIDALNKRDSSE